MEFSTPLSILATLLFLFHPISTVGFPDPNLTATTTTEFIRTSCSATLYPDLCYSSLVGYASAVQNDSARLARVAIGVSLSRARRMANYLNNVTAEADYGGGEPRVTAAVHDCRSVFGDAVDEIHDSLTQMRQLGYGTESLRFQLSNVQTWMSAALTNEDTCMDGFQDVQDVKLKTDVCDRAGKVKQVTSNALALVNSYVSKVTTP